MDFRICILVGEEKVSNILIKRINSIIIGLPPKMKYGGGKTTQNCVNLRNFTISIILTYRVKKTVKEGKKLDK